MDMQGISRRHFVPANASANVTATKASSSDAAAKPAGAANTAADNADTPATTSHLSPAGRFMAFMQHLETEHPEETKRVLNGIADRLHFDAKIAGPFFGHTLNTIADRFQTAADTGDLSNLVPQRAGFGHHAMRAYQTAAGGGDAAANAGAAVSSNGAAPANAAAPADTTTAPATAADDTATPPVAGPEPGATTAPVATAASDTHATAGVEIDDTTTTDDAAAMAAAANPAVVETTSAAANAGATSSAAQSGSDQDVKAWEVS
jgi:hypothetical protein